MANTRVSGVLQQVGGSGNISITVQAGDSIVVCGVVSNTSASVTGITWDSAGDNQALTQIGTHQANNVHTQCMWYLDGTTSGKTGNLSVSSTAGTWFYYVQILRGTPGMSILSTSDAATGTSTTPTVSLTGVSANATIVAIVSNDNSFGSGNYTAGAGYTKVLTGASNATDNYPNPNSYAAAEYLVDAGASGNKSVTFTAASSPWMMKAAAFSTAGGGGGGGIVRQMLMHH